jgi:hypothetical protein
MILALMGCWISNEKQVQVSDFEELQIISDVQIQNKYDTEYDNPMLAEEIDACHDLTASVFFDSSTVTNEEDVVLEYAWFDTSSGEARLIGDAQLLAFESFSPNMSIFLEVTPRVGDLVHQPYITDTIEFMDINLRVIAPDYYPNGQNSVKDGIHAELKVIDDFGSILDFDEAQVYEDCEGVIWDFMFIWGSLTNSEFTKTTAGDVIQLIECEDECDSSSLPSPIVAGDDWRVEVFASIDQEYSYFQSVIDEVHNSTEHFVLQNSPIDFTGFTLNQNGTQMTDVLDPQTRVDCSGSILDYDSDALLISYVFETKLSDGNTTNWSVLQESESSYLEPTYSVAFNDTTINSLIPNPSGEEVFLRCKVFVSENNSLTTYMQYSNDINVVNP